MSMTKVIVVILGLCLLSIAACSQAAGPVEANLDAPFTLALGQSTSLDNELSVTFNEVTADSRCPRQVTCAEAGFARVLLEVRLGDDEALTYELNTEPQFELDEITHGPYTIQLVELAPYPETAEELAALDAYRLTLVVSKNQ